MYKMRSKKKNILIFLICITGFTFTSITCLSQVTNLVSFEIKDQFKNVYTENSWPDKILIILGSNKSGSKYNPIWVKAISDSIQKILPKLAVKQVGVANLNSVPFFLKGFIRKKFPDDPENRILMDWNGLFSKTYNFIEGKSNILIFNLERDLVYQTTVKELDEIILTEILSILKKQDNLR